MQDWTMTFQSKEVPAWTLQVALVVKNLPANVGYSIDAGSIPGLGRSPGGGKRQPRSTALLSTYEILCDPSYFINFPNLQLNGKEYFCYSQFFIFLVKSQIDFM